MLRLRHALVAAAALAGAAACAAEDPGPAPERTAEPTLPIFRACASPIACFPGEECRSGFCVRADGGAGPLLDAGSSSAIGACPQGCGLDEVCSIGVCVRQRPDAGPALDRCGGCPLGLDCDGSTGICRLPGAGTPGD
jgi:hypothetical protein